MPRFSGKTYGGKKEKSDASKAFDGVINSNVGAAKSRFGATSFTSMRGAASEAEARKRKIEDEDREGDSLFDDPFSFETEDTGPTQPKRGMGFKVEEKPKPTAQKGRSSKLKKDENNDEKDTMKQAPTKTYARSRVSKAPNPVDNKNKQLSMDKFASKLKTSNNSADNSNKVFRLTIKGSNKSTNSDNGSSKGTPKRFFTSSQQHYTSLDEASNQSSNNTDKGSELFESDYEYDSDQLANLDSGDPEIIFNSPQKRKREEQEEEEKKDEGNSPGRKPDNNESFNIYAKEKKDKVTKDLFSDTIVENTVYHNSKRPRIGIDGGEKKDVFSADDSDEDDSDNDTTITPNVDDNVAKVVKDHKNQTTDNKSGDKRLTASELFDLAIKVEPIKRNIKSSSPRKKESSSDLFDKAMLSSSSVKRPGTPKKDPMSTSLYDESAHKSPTRNINISYKYSSHSRIDWKPTKSHVFDDSDDEKTGDQVSVKTDSIRNSAKSKSSHKNEIIKYTGKDKSDSKIKKKNAQSDNLFDDGGSDGNDTDDLSGSQPLDQSSSRHHGMKSQGSAMRHSTISGAQSVPGFKRSLSVESSGSSGSRDALRKSCSLGNKLLNMDVERGKKKEPIVRRLLTSPKKGGKQVKALYNARSWREIEMEEELSKQASQESGASTSTSVYEEFSQPSGVKLQENPTVRRLVRKPNSPYEEDYTSVKVHKEHKQLFTVVKQVKGAHECLEHGENQDFNDELEYILDGLKDEQPLSVRCLSCLNMSTKCAQQSFRMHLRAHGTLDKVFGVLHNAYEFPSLALCTAAVLFLLSRDRFSMDLEKSTLTLMLRLLSVDSQEQSPNKNNKINSEYQHIQEKLREIFRTIVKNGDKLEIDSITTGRLTMESLLSLTSKKSGDWFKEELRLLGGLDHIIKTVSECTDELDEVSIEPTDQCLDQLHKIERCLRVLENVTYLNSENQNYLVSHKSCLLVKALYKTFTVCENCLTFNPLEEISGKVNKDCIGFVLFSSLLAVIRVLLNLTHDNAYTSTKVGQQEGLIKRGLICLLRIPQYIPSIQTFDLLVLGLGLLINVVEHCEHNRDILIATKAVCPYDETSPISKLGGQMDSLEALSKLFLLRYEAAKRIEIEHDEELDERERLKQERMALANQLTVVHEGNGGSGTVANKSGEWKHSESGLEWVVLEENEEERIEKELARDSDSDMDVEVLPNPSQDEEENFTKALHRAGRHMEDCILAAYVALLLGCTIQGNMDHIDRVRDCLPEGDFEPMIRMLRKFLGFMNFTATAAVSQSSGSKSITRIIEVLEAC